MGGGDIKLLAWIGAVLGWKAIPFVVLISSVLSAASSASRSRLGRKAGLRPPFPFGPYLALGAIVLMFVSLTHMADWYFHSVFAVSSALTMRPKAMSDWSSLDRFDIRLGVRCNF